MTEHKINSFAANLLTYADKQLKRLTSSAELVASNGDADAVHDLRVASRRLAAPLRIMAAFIGARKVEKVVRNLRRLRRAFRGVRDLDVVQMSLCGQAPAHLETTALAHLEGVLTRQRERALRSGRRRAEGIDLDVLAVDVRGITRQFTEALEELSEDNIHTLAREAVVVWTARLAERDPRKPETTHLHETRLCVKRLRYAAELVRDLEGREQDSLIPALAEIQELLGQWNDHLTAAAKISKIARRVCIRGEEPAWAARLLEYSASRAGAAHVLRSQIIEAWPALAADPQLSPQGSAGLPLDHATRESA